jgi:catechol 2,3-dioxygenase-like lactoylglutathione lyase family enzyme
MVLVDELENIRKRAKQLVRDHRAGLVTVPERIRRGLPGFAQMTDREILAARFRLSDAQQLLAVEFGYGGWGELAAASTPPERVAAISEKSWVAFAQVLVCDIETSVAWYRDVLGFGVDYVYGDPPFYAQLRRNTVAFNLRRTGDQRRARPPVDEELLAVRIEVGDVKALYPQVRANGAELHQTLRTEPWGQRTFVVSDPDGNLLSFGSHMSTPPNPKGDR